MSDEPLFPHGLPSRLHSVDRRDCLIVRVAEGNGIEGDPVYEATYVYEVATGALVGKSERPESSRSVAALGRIDVGGRGHVQ